METSFDTFLLLFLNLNNFKFDQNRDMGGRSLIKRKGTEIAELIKNFSFEGVWSELVKKNCFQRQSKAKDIIKTKKKIKDYQKQ